MSDCGLQSAVRNPQSAIAMTVPTKLSLLRILLAFLIMALLTVPGLAAKGAALGCFLAASLTDWLDGWLARRWNQVSPLGALLDPIADKVLVLGTFLAFVQLRLIPAWMVLIVVLRELLITGVRLFAASRGVILAAAKEGKHKTVSQMATIVVILVVLIVREWMGPGGVDAATEARLKLIIMSCMWMTVILTLVSGASFFWRHRAVLWEAVSR
jgi:CDP-diacylglycerol--glycerol-3-phosphate 3-phosphatidyltransferase